MKTLRPGEDNLVRWLGMKRASTDALITDATATFTLYKQIADDGSMSAAGTALTSADAPFVAGDVNRAVIVTGAAADGSDLRTTISAFVSASEVTLADAAAKAVSGAIVLMSIDNAKEVAMPYDGASGNYSGVMDRLVPLVASRQYTLEIEATSAGADGLRRVACTALYHEETP